MTTRQVPDTGLAAQPAAYWTGLAYEALIAFTRAEQGGLGFTQAQFRLLSNLSRNGISPDGHGMTVPELQQAVSSCVRTEDDLESEARALPERGWLTRDTQGLLRITGAGEEARLRLERHAPHIRGRIHLGIDDAHCITALKVLRQMIRNTAGTV